MDLAIIVLSLILLMVFAYKGFSLIFIAPVFAVLAAVTSDYASMPVYSELYMTKAAEYIKSYYPVFLLGAAFAKIMEEGGLAASVASKIVSVLGKERAVLAVLLGCGVLTYGGLSVFVVAFVMYPFAAILFKQADIPKRLLPAPMRENGNVCRFPILPSKQARGISLYFPIRPMLLPRDLSVSHSVSTSKP